MNKVARVYAIVLTIIVAVGLSFYIYKFVSPEPTALTEGPLQPDITIGKSAINYHRGSYCWFSTPGEPGTCGDPIEPGAFYKRIHENAANAEPGEEVTIKFSSKPDKLTLQITDEQGLQQKVLGDTGPRFTLPEKEGYYRYVISAAWGTENEASYYFGVTILNK
ncbi:MAG: hypothetical protein K6T94_21655 [Paenibacillus sp.]|nr:hypothetical protein [Paenibacillus sp.]